MMEYPSFSGESIAFPQLIICKPFEGRLARELHKPE